MGNVLRCRPPSMDPDVAWKLQNKAMAENPMYKFVDLAKGGKLIQVYKDHGPERVKEIVRMEMKPYLNNGGEGKIITKLEYIKWCQMMKAKAMDTEVEKKSDTQLVSEFEEDPFNQFEPHEACWDIFKRGGVGETPFHLCYLMDTPVHFEVGKALLEVFPKLALDVYEGEEYFGESALHIAIILGDLDAVQLLVKCGAKVNQRATGRFFLPEDQKKTATGETNYDGYAYYGEYPLAFAACRGDQEIYDFLLSHGADPNLQDSFGNTVLHMVVIHEQPQMFRHAVKHHVFAARTDITNKKNLTPLTLAGKLGRIHIFMDMLDLGSIEFWRFSNTACSAYPLAAIDSIGTNGDTNWHSALMIIVNGESDAHLDMLEGGVIGQLLRDKWKAFARRRFIERLVMACFHLALLSIAIYTRPMGPELLEHSGAKDTVRYFCEVVVCLSCVATIIMEAIEIYSQGLLTFLKNCVHAPDQTIYLLSCLLLLSCIPFRFLGFHVVEDVLLIIAAPGSWFFLLFFARGVWLTGPFVTMVYKMCSGDLARFGIIYLIFLVGFTQGFFFLFRDVTTDNADVLKFSTLPDTILNLFQMTLGEFKYEVFNYSHYSWLTKLVFAIFMILMPILLLNMLIAMMGNTYTQVISKSEKEWRKQWAKIVVVLERGFSKKQLLKFQRDYSVKLAGPPKHQLGEYCDPSVEQRALVVIKTEDKSRAKRVKGAVMNWKRLGKELIRQLRSHKLSGSKGAFEIGKRRGTSALEDSGLPILTTTVQQLAWERDIDLTKDKPFFGDSDQMDEALSPRSPARVPPTTQSMVPNGGPHTKMADGKTTQQNQQLARHQQLLSQPAGTPTRKRSLAYNRVAPLLPPLPQENSGAWLQNEDASDSNQGNTREPKPPASRDSKSDSGVLKEECRDSKHVNPDSKPSSGHSKAGNEALEAGSSSQTGKDSADGSGVSQNSEKSQGNKKMSVFSNKDSVLALDLKSLSSWGETTQQSISEGTPRPLLSPKKERGVGGFRDLDSGRSVSPSRYSPGRNLRDIEAGEAGEWSEMLPLQTLSEPPTVTFTPERRRKHKKKRAKGEKMSWSSSGSPKRRSPEGKRAAGSSSPRPLDEDFDSLA